MRNDDAKAVWHAIVDLATNEEAQAKRREVDAVVGAPARVAKLLLHLPTDEGRPMRDLAEQFACDASYVTALVDELEQRGLAERRAQAEDRRVKTVVLTAEGERVRDQALAVLWEPPAAFSRLSAGELKELRRLLDRVGGEQPAPR